MAEQVIKEQPEIDSLNLLAKGFQESEKVQLKYPDGSGDNFNLTQDEYLRNYSETDEPEINVENIQDQFLDDALNGKVDINKFFDKKYHISKSTINEAIAAQNEIRLSQQNNQPLANINELNEKIDLLKDQYYGTINSSDVLRTGRYDTGSIPINAVTNEPIFPSNMNQFEDQNWIGEMLIPNQKTLITEKLNQQKNFMQWASKQPNAPKDKVILQSIARSFSTDMSANLARRFYEISGFLQEGGGFYLPILLEGAYNKWAVSAHNAMFDSEWGRSRDTWFPKDTQKRLLQYRSESNWFKDGVGDTDRHRIVNEIVRDELRKKLGEPKFDELGYNEKIVVDGVEVFKRNFVTPDFANQVFEYAMDDMNFFEQLAVFIGEGAGITKAIMFPFQATSKVIKGARATSDAIHRTIHQSKYGKGVPFNVNTIDKKLAGSIHYSNVHNISLEQAAMQLSLKKTNQNWYHQHNAKRIAKMVNKKYNKNVDAEKFKQAKNKLNQLDDELGDAVSKGNTKLADAIREEIRVTKDTLNYQYWKSFSPYVAGMGLNPVFDIFMGVSQATGRQMYSGTAFGFGTDIPDTRESAKGEAVGLLTYMSIAATKKLYGLKGPRIPIVSNVMDNVAYGTKIWTENITGILLKAVTGGTLDGRGMLVNPTLRQLEKLKTDLNLSTTEIRTIDNFAQNAKQNLNEKQIDILLTNLVETVNDINLITKDIPLKYRGDIRQTLMLSVSEASGVSAFMGYANVLKLQEMAFKNSDVTKFKNKVKNAFDMQIKMEERVNAFGGIVDTLKAQILKMEKAGDVNPEVMARLKAQRNVYVNAKNNSTTMLNEFLESRVQEIDQFLKELQQPDNVHILKYFTSGGKGGENLKLLFKLRNDSARALMQNVDFGTKRSKKIGLESDVDYVPSMGSVEKSAYQTKKPLLTGSEMDIGQGLTETQRKLVVGAFDVDEAATKMIEAIAESNKRLRLTQTSQDVLTNSNKNIRAVISIMDATQETKVNNLYAKISTDQTIDFSVTGNSIYKFLNTYKQEEGYLFDVARLLNPNNSPFKNTIEGQKLLNTLDDAAKRGMDDLFNDPDVVNMLNNSLPRGVKKFEVGDSAKIIEHFQELARTRKDVIEKYGLSKTGNESYLSNFQLMHFLKEQKNLNFIAEDFDFVAAPKNVEELRQAFQLFGKSKNDKISTMGKAIVNFIDQDFRTWAKGLNEVDYNNILVARKTHRILNQRFDKGTIGYQIKTMMAGGNIKILGEDVDSKNLMTVFKPMIDAIVKPTDDSASILEREMKRLIITFAPPSDASIAKLLKKEGNEVREVTDAELIDMIDPVIDLGTKEGVAFANKMVLIIDNMLRSAFIKTKGLDNVATQVKRGEVIDGDAMILGNVKIADKEGINMPKQISLPSGGQFNSVEEYIDYVENLIKVDYKLPNGEMARGQPLVNVRELLADENYISDAIMSSKKWRKVHDDYIVLVQNEVNVSIKSPLSPKAQIQNIEIESYKNSLLYKNNMSGESFLNDVIYSGDPNSVDDYINDLNRLVKIGQMTVDDKKHILQALFVDLLRTSGGESPYKEKFTFGNAKLPKKNYTTPEVTFNLLTEYAEIGEDGKRTAMSFVSDKFRKIMTEAGVTQEQEDLLIALYRHGVKMDVQGVIKRSPDETAISQAGPRPVFTLNNTLSKAFNLARGMVSTKYVMAEMAIRYAALSDGAILNTILNDNRVTAILTDLLTDEKKVTTADADYFVKALTKYSAVGIRNYFGKDTFEKDAFANEKKYWEDRNVIYVQNVPLTRN